MQWLEGNLAPQVVWEILPPGKTCRELLREFEFYERYGVEEYVVFDPETQDLIVYQRVDGHLRAVDDPRNWVSPRTGVHFDFSGEEMCVVGPHGRPFLSYVELARLIKQDSQEIERIQRQTEQFQRQAKEDRARCERLAAQLRALGIEPEA